MSQNIYDDAGFFGGYSQLERSKHGLNGAPEWPALRAMLPPLRGRAVLDLGCGFGWFCRWAREAGAARVVGVDLSENMLARAAEMTAAAMLEDDAIEYRRADLEAIEPEAGAFDLVYSSLALHYVADLGRLVRAVHRSLVPGGSFVFSAEHPMFTAPSAPRWTEGPGGGKVWPIDGYLREGPRSTDWLAKGVIKHHRPMGVTLTRLLEAAFTLTHVVEWGPSDAQVAARPEFAIERERPTFMMVAARR